MAETIPPSPTTAPPATPEQQFHAHHQTYNRAMHIAWVATVAILTLVVGLGIGGTSGRWIIGGFWILIAAIAFAVSAPNNRMGARPGLVVLALALLTLLLVSY